MSDDLAQLEKALYFNKPDVAALIRETEDAYHVKLIGKCKAGPNRDSGLKLTGDERKEWDRRTEDRADSLACKTLAKAMHAKFNNNRRLAQLLLDTGDDNLVYHDESTWWGDGNGKKSGALNLVGKELMLIRSQLRQRANA